MLIALTREVSPSIASCELEFLDREPIDVALAQEQHRHYQSCLTELGVHVETLPAEPGMPDGVFVEDPAIVLDEVAVITRMGAVSRRGEAETLARALAGYRELLRIQDPATLEGGDVMRVGKTLYVGYSRRTNVAGIQQLSALLHPLGYFVVPVEVLGCLHLKSACCYIGDDTVLANRTWMDPDALCGLKILDVPEPRAANALRIGDTVLMPAAYPRTCEMLNRSGFRLRTIDNSELLKAEAGVTCTSLVFDS
ncbi:MAG TPA: arginine deiminase family protein [Bryobacteraceae bacterium]|nr:arginine deiminase family protein [Bryobacteraceae bacterium]